MNQNLELMTSARISIAGTFTLEPLGPVLKFWLDKLGFSFEIEFAPFGQLFQSLLDPRGALRSNKDGVAALFVRRVDLGVNATEQKKAARDLRDALEASLAESGTPHIIVVCPSPDSDDARARSADIALANTLGSAAGLDAVTPETIAALYPTETCHDAFSEHEGGMPFTDEYYVALATVLARRIRVARSAPKKVLVVDCDDTLWGGVVGEVGVEGVILDEPRLTLQRFLLEQRAQGMLLCIVSKNNEADALAVFDERQEMLLRREHLTSWRINWKPKSENIRDLARELELGLDSFVLLDDDAFVVNEAREAARGVVAVQLPEDPARIPDLLAGLWVLDRGRVTAEDRRRADAYKEKSERDRLRRTLSHADFLATLALEVTVLPMTEDQVPRVAQLTVRTNQFNAIPHHRTEAEVRGGQGEWVVVHVRDRFGEYGLTGAVMFVVTGDRLNVRSFLLSCRVLGRGVEHEIVRALGRLAAARGLAGIVLPFKPSGRNAPYASFFASLPAVHRDVEDDVQTAVLDTAAALAIRFDPEASVAVVDEETAASMAQSPTAGEPVRGSFDDRGVALTLSRVADIRAALPRRTGGGSDSAGSQTEIEASLITIVRNVLLLDSLSAKDDLFEVGMDSVGALRVLAKVNQQLGVEMALYEIFQLDPPNVAKLAEVVESKRGVAPRVDATPPPVTRSSDASGTLNAYVQDVILTWEAGREPTPVWTAASRLRLRGKVDVEVLRSAIQHMLMRQEALRQVYRREGETWRGRLCDASEVAFEVHDMRSSSDEQVSAFCDRLANTAVPIDDNPLIRFLLLERAVDDYVLVAVWHHVILDPKLATVMSDEIADTYEALIEKRKPPGPLPIRFVDYARWQRNWWNGGGKPLAELARDRVMSARPFELTDHPRGGRVSSEQWLRLQQLDETGTSRLEAVSRASGVSLFTLFAALTSALLARWSGRNDTVFATVVNLRAHSTAFANVLGRFSNTTTALIDVSGVDTFGELLERAKAGVVDAHRYGTVPASLVHETLGVLEHPLNRVLLNTPVVGGTTYERTVGTDAFTIRQEYVQARSGARSDLSIFLGSSEGRLFANMSGAKELFEESTIAKRASELRFALETLETSTRLTELFEQN